LSSEHRNIILSDQGKDLIRLEFHKLIEEKVYPSSDKLLIRLKEKKVSEIFVLTQTITREKHHVALFFHCLAWFYLSANIKNKSCIGFRGVCCSESKVFSDS
jgi:hypothetical protein